MLICFYLKAGCGLEFLAELDFLLVWTLDGEELYTILPEWQTIYLLIQHLECSGFLYKEKEIVYVLYIDGDVVNGSIFHLSLMVLIGLDDEIVELEEGYFLCAVYCAEGCLKAQGMIKLNGLVDVVGRNAVFFREIERGLHHLVGLLLRGGLERRDKGELAVEA